MLPNPTLVFCVLFVFKTHPTDGVRCGENFADHYFICAIERNACKRVYIPLLQ